MKYISMVCVADQQQVPNTESRDDEFDPSGPVVKKNRQKKSTLTEDVRADNHTLQEHHDHLLSASFDLSFSASGSYDSQPDPLDDMLFPLDDGIDLGGVLGDELAKELGEGWGGSPFKHQYFLRSFDILPAQRSIGTV